MRQENEVTPGAPNTENAAPAAAPAVEPTPQDASREAIYNKYYGDQPAAPAAEPAAAAEPAVDYKAAFEALTAEVSSLKAALTKPEAPPAPEPEPDWFSLLQQGKREAAEAALKNMVAKDASQAIVQQSVAQALEMVRVQESVNSINNDLRVKNPDLIPFEKWIAIDAESRFNQVKDSIKSSEDYLKVYNRVVTEAADEVRKQFQLARAAGNRDAMITRREVLTASTLAPNAVQSPREAVQEGQEQSPDMSPNSYLSQRMQRGNALRGLSN